MAESSDGDPHHAIFPQPWKWQLAEFTYRTNADDWRLSYIDLVLVLGNARLRLRFFAPQDLEICQGLPSSSGLCILDVSARQLDGLKVRVACFEQNYGTPTFWAASVVELHDNEDANGPWQ